MRDGLENIGTCDEHIARLFNHENKVGDGRRVDRAARAGSHNGRNLRYDARGQRVAQENICVRAQADHAFLDTCPTRVIQANDWSAILHSQVHNLANFLGVCLGKRTTKDCEILRKDVNQAAVDLTIARDNSITGNSLIVQAKVCGAMCDKHVQFIECAWIEQQVKSFSCG